MMIEGLIIANIIIVTVVSFIVDAMTGFKAGPPIKL